MKVFVGLGNPGKEYTHTRHNVGFFMVDLLQKAWNLSDWKDSKFHGIICEGIYNGEKILLLKPTTYMNLSGQSVDSILGFYKLDPKLDLCVISDDIDMEFAKVRFRKDGSHGGQNGLRDIIEKLGTNEFSRIKIGIGRNDQYSVSDWVLSVFTKDEMQVVESEIYIKAEEYIKKWL